MAKHETALTVQDLTLRGLNMSIENSLFKKAHSAGAVLKKLALFNKLNKKQEGQSNQKKNKHSCANLFKITHSTGMTLKKWADLKGVEDFAQQTSQPFETYLLPCVNH